MIKPAMVDIFSSNYDGSVWTEKFYNYFYGQGYKYHDQWYGFIEGNDLFADVMVGRMPDSNTTRMDYLLSKSIWYEQYPYIDGTWQRKAAMTPDADISPTINTKHAISDNLSAFKKESMSDYLCIGIFQTYQQASNYIKRLRKYESS